MNETTQKDINEKVENKFKNKKKIKKFIIINVCSSVESQLISK